MAGDTEKKTVMGTPPPSRSGVLTPPPTAGTAPPASVPAYTPAPGPVPTQAAATQAAPVPAPPPPTPVPAPPPAGWNDSTRPGEISGSPHQAPVYTPPVDLLLGQTLAGRYVVQKKLGEGGMGAVYLAQHNVLEKMMALKILHGEFARKPDLVERFMQEAKAASRIRHENVIDISDFGITADGLVFFAMELLTGHDLHEEIARARLSHTKLPWERSRKIFLQICSALSAAHGHGIVHRDLKPENIYLVEWAGHKDFVKLLDFGIAKLTEVSEGDRKLTRTGMLFGTPEYMSPEQARGENVDHRVDVYAMGCILFQLVTTRVPFEAENFMGILSLHLTEPPPPIGTPILDEVGAPHGVEEIVARALAKNREERWQTIDEMANAIRALHGEDAQPISEVRVPRATSVVKAGSTPPAAGRTASDAPGMGRQRTEWKGGLTIPTEEVMASAPTKARWPWIAGAVLVAGAAGATAFVMIGSKKAREVPVAPVQGPGTAGLTLEAPIPARVTISLDSEPTGAEVYDDTTNRVVGKTPFELELPGSRDPRRYTFRLAGFAGKMIELLPVENVEYRAALKPLVAGTTAAAVAPEIEVVPQRSRRGSSGSTALPGPGSTAGSTAGSSAGSMVGSGALPTTPDGPTLLPDKPDKPDGPAIKPDKPDGPAIKPDKPDGPAIKPDKPDGPAIKPDKPDGPVIKPDDTPIKIKDPFATGGGGASPPATP